MVANAALFLSKPSLAIYPKLSVIRERKKKQYLQSFSHIEWKRNSTAGCHQSAQNAHAYELLLVF
jgi:hypothetical protein